MKALKDLGKWMIITMLVSVFCGLSASLFLFLLDFVGQIRSQHNWFYFLLPFFGLAIVFSYHRFSLESQGGNDLILSEIYKPKSTLSSWMTPLVLGSTLLTHLGGGSAGREGTAVQVGASLADSLNKLFVLTELDRKRLLKMGIAGGFAAVFGTPLAGSLFAIEVLRIKERNWYDVLFVSLTAYASNFICHLTTIQHTNYSLDAACLFSADFLFWLFVSAILFGLAALSYIFISTYLRVSFSKYLPNPYVRIFIGGSLISLFFLTTQLHHLSGLGVQSIVSSFSVSSQNLDFALKILLTALTLSVGFKGGEVTPLFFIGATLANFLSFWIPLPLPLIVACGFVSVFGAATKTPYASSILGAEIFGWQYFIMLLISCYIATYTSGTYSIYKTQIKRRFWWEESIITWLKSK